MSHRSAEAGVADFDDAVNRECKQVVREVLVLEHRGLCCYCCGRITPSTMRIEHLVPQSNAARGHELRMVWSNLFGACLGGEGSPPREQHCDTRKGDRESPLSPLDPMLAERLRYSRGGQIESDEPGLADDLHDVLGLNGSKLVNNRRAVILRMEQFAKKNAPKNAPSTWFEAKLAKLASSSKTELESLFAGAGVLASEACPRPTRSFHGALRRAELVAWMRRAESSRPSHQLPT